MWTVDDFVAVKASNNHKVQLTSKNGLQQVPPRRHGATEKKEIKTKSKTSPPTARRGGQRSQRKTEGTERKLGNGVKKKNYGFALAADPRHARTGLSHMNVAQQGRNQNPKSTTETRSHGEEGKKEIKTKSKNLTTHGTPGRAKVTEKNRGHGKKAGEWGKEKELWFCSSRGSTARRDRSFADERRPKPLAANQRE